MPRGQHGRSGSRAWRKDRDTCIAANTHCWLCGLVVDKTLTGRHPMGPTADHIVPISEGGPELVKDGAELRLAHNRCNSARSGRSRAGQPRRRRATPTPAPARTRTSRAW